MGYKNHTDIVFFFINSIQFLPSITKFYFTGILFSKLSLYGSESGRTLKSLTFNLFVLGVKKLPLSYSLIFEKGFLENRYLFGSYRGAPGKSLSVRKPKKRLLENRFFLFGSQKRKKCFRIIGICSVNTLSFLKTPEKGTPGRKEEKIFSVAASALEK